MIYHRQACDGDNGSLVIVLMTWWHPYGDTLYHGRGATRISGGVKCPRYIFQARCVSDFAVFSVGGNRDKPTFYVSPRLNFFDSRFAFRVDIYITFIGD